MNLDSDLQTLNMNDSGTFLFLNDQNELDAELVDQNQPKDEGWLWRMGTGPTIINKIYSVANTGIQCTVGTLYPYPYEKSNDPIIRKMQARVANPGLQLGSNDIYQFITGIEAENPLNHISFFYFQSSILDFALDEIKENIDQFSKSFDLNLPIIIPINFNGYGLLERNHIASIIIKDGVVDYYDSKGILSENKILKCGKSLQDVLKYCVEKFNCKNIAENPYIHQYDAHNCGVFVCYHIYSKIVENQLIGTVTVQAPTTSEIQDFRETINKIAY